MELIGQCFGQILGAFNLGLVDDCRLSLGLGLDCETDKRQGKDQYILTMSAIHSAKLLFLGGGSQKRRKTT